MIITVGNTVVGFVKAFTATDLSYYFAIYRLEVILSLVKS